MNTCRDLADALPDTPRWLQPRAWLLAGECDVFGSRHDAGYVLRSTRSPIAAVVGVPPVEALLRAVDIIGSETELLVAPPQREHVQNVLRYWKQLNAVLHLRPTAAMVDDTPSDESVTIADPWTLRHGRDLPPPLQRAARHSHIVAARQVNGRAVAVCHTDAVSESLWDVGVDTLESHRRAGHARACFAAMDWYMSAQSRQPMWGALETNTASRAMAASLGFEAVDTLSIFISPNRRSEV